MNEGMKAVNRWSWQSQSYQVIFGAEVFGNTILAKFVGNGPALRRSNDTDIFTEKNTAFLVKMSIGPLIKLISLFPKITKDLIHSHKMVNLPQQ